MSGLADLELSVTEQGAGRPVVVIHGGGGPASVAPLVEHLSSRSHVLAATLPGWDGTPRPAWLEDVDDLACLVLDRMRRERLEDVALVGSSIGGWVAMAVAGLDVDRGRVSQLCLIDSVGIEVTGSPIRDFFALDPREIADYSFHDGDRFYVDPASLTDDARATQAANITSLRAVAGDPYMHDPRLRRRLGRIGIPVLGIWGSDDRIVTTDYGRALLSEFPNSRLDIVPGAGHLPHLEQPQACFAALDRFLDR